jgi:hypothetical protein
MKDEALDRNVWKIHFGRGYRPLLRETVCC